MKNHLFRKHWNKQSFHKWVNHAIFRDGYDKFHLHELKKISLLPWPAGIINLHFRCLPLMFYHHTGLTVTWKIHSRLFFKISKPTHISLSHHKSAANISCWIFFSFLHYSELCIWIVGLINPVVGLLNEWHLSPDCKGLHVSLSSHISLGMK